MQKRRWEEKSTDSLLGEWGAKMGGRDMKKKAVGQILEVSEMQDYWSTRRSEWDAENFGYRNSYPKFTS